MPDEALSQIKAEALAHLKTMPKPKPDDSATAWKAYADFWTKFKPEEENGNEGLDTFCAEIKEMLRKMEEQSEKDEIIDLKGELARCQRELMTLKENCK